MSSVDGSLQQNENFCGTEPNQQSRLFTIGICFERTADYGINQLMEGEEEEDGRKDSCAPSKDSNYALTTANGRAAARFSIGGTSLLRDADDDDNGICDFVAVEERQTAAKCGGEAAQAVEQNNLQNVSLDALEDENSEAVCGDYSKHYDT